MIYTVAPASPSCRAMPLPIPREAPVTIQTLPDSDILDDVLNKERVSLPISLGASRSSDVGWFDRLGLNTEDRRVLNDKFYMYHEKWHLSLNVLYTNFNTRFKYLYLHPLNFKLWNVTMSYVMESTILAVHDCPCVNIQAYLRIVSYHLVRLIMNWCPIKVHVYII